MPESLYALALLACPLGMGAMMWMMMRGSNKPSEADSAATRAELTELQAQINHLRDAKIEGQRPEARKLRS
ncbi:MAG: hypothetical protein M3Q75_15615 [Gemmatimonadota bacterium]|nr:hypothetical protein [Gemmatimonadota bacterium]